MTAPAFEIFRAGRHTDSSGRTFIFSNADLELTAKAYDAKRHEAPIVVGHPADDGPAYGWVKALRYADGTLTAEADQVDTGFADLVKAGRFKKISASFYLPDAQGNPSPGVYSLRHVGFLGAQPPAVKGLKPVELSDDGYGCATFGEISSWSISSAFRRMREWMISEFGLEKADAVLPGYMVDDMRDDAQATPSPAAPTPAFSEEHKEQNMSQPAHASEAPVDVAPVDVAPVDLAEERKAIEAERAQLAADRAKIEADRGAVDHDKAEFAAEQRKTGAARFVDGLVTDGKVLPRDRDGLAAFLARLDDAETASFGEGEAQTPAAYFKGYLSSQPKHVEYRETGAGDGGAIDRSDPQALARAATDFIEAERKQGRFVTADQAVRHVVKETAQ